jgi:hypothetical protein
VARGGPEMAANSGWLVEEEAFPVEVPAARARGGWWM